jgi:osmotically-inducible protein OsmY
MSKARSNHAWKFTFALVVASTLPGGAAFAKSESNSRNDDAIITQNVRTELAEHPGVEPNAISVQTRDHVVYLYGLVSSSLQSDTAAAIAHDQPGVIRVVNSIAETNGE